MEKTIQALEIKGILSYILLQSLNIVNLITLSARWNDKKNNVTSLICFCISHRAFILYLIYSIPIDWRMYL